MPRSLGTSPVHLEIGATRAQAAHTETHAAHVDGMTKRRHGHYSDFSCGYPDITEKGDGCK
jgi:hypothetical protein